MALLIWVGVLVELSVGLIKLAEVNPDPNPDPNPNPNPSPNPNPNPNPSPNPNPNPNPSPNPNPNPHQGRQGASGPTEDLVDFGVLLLLQLMNALVGWHEECKAGD